MAAYGVTSLPIVESGGRAVGVISATDVLHGTKDLDLRVREFIALSRRAAGISQEPHCIVKCAPHDGVLDALRLMMHEEVRHVYVLDASDTPVGVFSSLTRYVPPSWMRRNCDALGPTTINHHGVEGGGN